MNAPSVKAQKPRVAMTGATGFVGLKTLNLLHEQGHEVVALVRDKQRACTLLPANTLMIEGDLGNQRALDELAGSADLVLHVAGAISAANDAAFAEANVAGTRNVANAALKAGVRRFVHVSSLAAREPGLSAYCRTKAEGEAVVIALEDKLDWIVIRPPAVYGPGDKATLPLIQQLSQPTSFLTGTENQRISVIHVDDLARALVAACSDEVAARKVYEVDDATPGGYAWADLAAASGESLRHVPKVKLLPKLLLELAGAACGLAKTVTGKSIILSPGKVRELYHEDWVIHGPRLDETGHWQPQVRFAQGFADTLEWYKKNGWLPES